MCQVLYVSSTMRCKLCHRVELSLTETDHLWLEHFIHETPPGFQEPSYTVLHPQDQMLEKLEMEL